jgi:hypothetical protein
MYIMKSLIKKRPSCFTVKFTNLSLARYYQSINSKIIQINKNTLIIKDRVRLKFKNETTD